jgi:hypothetical protein
MLIQYHKVTCQDVFKQGGRGKGFRAKRKPLERRQVFQGFNRGDSKWGYEWHVSYPMNTFNPPHCSMSSIFYVRDFKE